MQVVILSGGLATRLNSLRLDVPKSMIEVGGEPFLLHQIELLKKNNLLDIILCIGHLGDQIVNYFGNGERFGVNIKYSWEEDKLLGTGGAVKKAAHLLEDRFIVMYGDSYLDFNYNRYIKYFYGARVLALMAVYLNNDTIDKSNVTYRNGQITNYDKRGKQRLNYYIDYGATILSKKLLNLIPDKEFYDLSDLFTELSNKKMLFGYEISNRFYEIGSVKGIRDFEKYLKYTNKKLLEEKKNDCN